MPIDDHHLVSVVIPTKNRSELLSRAIKSVLNQTYKNLQIIIIDDASSDLTGEVIAEFQNANPCITYIRNTQSLGGAAARNIGMNNSQGEFIAFLDDDDEWLPHKVEKQADFLLKHPDYCAVSCLYYQIYKNRKVKKIIKADISYEYLLWGNGHCSFSLSMVRKQCINNEEEFIDPKLPAAQDWYFWLKIARRGKIYVVQDFLTIYDNNTLTTAERISTNNQNRYNGNRRLYLAYSREMTRKCRRKHIAELYFLKAKLCSTKLTQYYCLRKSIHFNIKLKYILYMILIILPYNIRNILKELFRLIFTP